MEGNTRKLQKIEHWQTHPKFNRQAKRRENEFRMTVNLIGKEIICLVKRKKRKR